MDPFIEIYREASVIFVFLNIREEVEENIRSVIIKIFKLINTKTLLHMEYRKKYVLCSDTKEADR